MGFIDFLNRLNESPQESIARTIVESVNNEIENEKRKIESEMPSIKRKLELLKKAFPYGYAEAEKIEKQRIAKNILCSGYPFMEKRLSEVGEAMLVEELQLIDSYKTNYKSTNIQSLNNPCLQFFDNIKFPFSFSLYYPFRKECLNRNNLYSVNNYSNETRKEFRPTDENNPRLKDEYYDIINGKYYFNIEKAIKAFEKLKENLLKNTNYYYDPSKPERERREKEKKEEERKRNERIQREREIKRKEESEYTSKGISTQLLNFKFQKEQILDFLSKNNVECFYHFTSYKNIKSIIEHGGLFSWYYLENHNISIPLAGGSDVSRSLDKRYGLHDYVRLSFCSNHPMAQKLKKRGERIIVLRIDVRVATLIDTLFGTPAKLCV